MTENRLDQPIGNNFRYGGIRQNCTLREWLNLDNRTVGYRPRQLALSTIQSLEAENARYLDLLKRIEPHINAIVCYASSMGEHEPNRLAHDLRASLNTEGEDGI